MAHSRQTSRENLTSSSGGVPIAFKHYLMIDPVGNLRYDIAGRFVLANIRLNGGSMSCWARSMGIPEQDRPETTSAS